MNQVGVDLGKYNKKLEDMVSLHLDFPLILQRYGLHAVVIEDSIFTLTKFGWNVLKTLLCSVKIEIVIL